MFAWRNKRFLITRAIFFLFMYYLFVNKLYKDVQGEAKDRTFQNEKKYHVFSGQLMIL